MYLTDEHLEGCMCITAIEIKPAVKSSWALSHVSCVNGVGIQRFEDCHCLHCHQTLTIEAKTVFETLDTNSVLTWLIAEEDFVAFSH
jgi:hypothetical protein